MAMNGRQTTPYTGEQWIWREEAVGKGGKVGESIVFPESPALRHRFPMGGGVGRQGRQTGLDILNSTSGEAARRGEKTEGM